MASSFPAGLDAWDEEQDNVDLVAAAHMNDLRDAVEKIEAKVGVDSSAVTTSFDYKANNFFVTGTKVWLYENAAPTGWTLVGGLGDRLLAIAGGTDAYNVAGGNTAGDTWTISGLTHSHTHDGTTNPDTLGQDEGGGSSNIAHVGHTHTFTTGAVSSATVSSDGTWRPSACVGVVVTKD